MEHLGTLLLVNPGHLGVILVLMISISWRNRERSECNEKSEKEEGEGKEAEEKRGTGEETRILKEQECSLFVA